MGHLEDEQANEVEGQAGTTAAPEVAEEEEKEATEESADKDVADEEETA